MKKENERGHEKRGAEVESLVELPEIEVRYVGGKVKGTKKEAVTEGKGQRNGK